MPGFCPLIRIRSILRLGRVAATTAVLLLALATSVTAKDLIIRGGWLFDGSGDAVVPNTGLVIRAGKFLEVGADLTTIADLDARELSGVDVITLSDEEYILPGMFDLHAHYGMDLFGRGRVDETHAYPVLFLANGVTSTYPAGELDPEKMMTLRHQINAGERVGARLFNSGPYFGAARYGWNRETTPEQIHKEVDYWAERGVRCFKAKGITAEHLRALLERAHQHGTPVTAHLGSGFQDTVNPRDAIRMGLDRVEHFLGGDMMPPDRSAYSSLENLAPDADLDDIVRLYLKHNVYFDATLTAYGYFGKRDPEVYTYFVDERAYLTPYMQDVLKQREPREPSEQFEKIYWVKRRTIRTFYEAGGGHLITLGTDHPSWGEYFTPFSVHRELHAMVLSGIPPAQALKIATINGARALNVGDLLGTIEPGKLADLFIVKGNPLQDIRNTRNVRLVIKGGNRYDAQALLESVRGTIGPAKADEISNWVRNK
jgi:imidazolonepropionase-like amidohydrolase